ncbi:MAG: hypothetical protein DCC67_06230 [Planctomycetota bacterium]|nr:MAG: hypothetical protein DCC67_06230 [Planctomycetota bacterium]
MGLYDREYSRETEPGFHVSAPSTLTTRLVLVTAAAYVAQLTLGVAFSANLALWSEWFSQPWRCYQLLTYGFLHDPNGIEHILINMLVLWMFGRELEHRYGKFEFAAFYLAAIVAAGAIWSVLETASGSEGVLLGASGGISAVVALFALNFPHRQVLFMFFIPMPMWVAALIGLAFDVNGAMDRSGNVAFTAHLAGALFGLLYYKFGWRLGGVFEKLPRGMPKRRPKLRVHDPDQPDDEDDLGRKVDAILEKIARQGQDSLTWNERRILEKASRRYQERRK